MVATFEYYPTPDWVILRWLEASWERLPWGGVWLEPAVGDGAIIRAVTCFAIARGLPLPRWITLDIDPQWEADLHGDFTSPEAVEALAGLGIDLVVTNPPFSLALEFATNGRKIARVATVLLLRMNWIATAKRREYVNNNRPRMYVLPQRPPFKPNKQGKKGSDATDYAWMCWGQSFEPGEYSVLALTPKSERSTTKPKKTKSKRQR